MMSFLQTALYFKEIGLKYSVCTISDSLINRARNNLVAKFMGNPDYTHMIFIDVDLQFDKESVLKLLWHDKDVMTASYPIKEISWDKVKEAAQADLPASDLMEYSTRYVVHMTKPGENQLNIDNGAIECYEAGTGFMLMKRHVLEKMIENYPDTMYYSDKDMTEDLEKRKRYALFDTMIDSDKRYLSEDYTFCRRWQELDGKIYLDVNTTLSHIGTYTFVGNGLVKPK
jgi:hypothetical protein